MRTFANCFNRELGSRDVVIMIFGSSTPAQRYSSSSLVVGSAQQIKIHTYRILDSREAQYFLCMLYLQQTYLPFKLSIYLKNVDDEIDKCTSRLEHYIFFLLKFLTTQYWIFWPWQPLYITTHSNNSLSRCRLCGSSCPRFSPWWHDFMLGKTNS